MNGQNNFEHSNTQYSIDHVQESISLEDIENHVSDTILSIMWRHGKVVSAYYKTKEKMLYTIMETVDKEPKFQVTGSLIREILPIRTITIGKLADPFVQALIGFVQNDDLRSATSGTYTTLPSNMTLLDYKDFSYNACLYRLKVMELQSHPIETDQSDRLSYIRTLVNIDSTAAVHTLGALIKFLEQTWHNMRPYSDDRLIFLHIKQKLLDDHVYIDSASYRAINIFNQMKHDSGFKHGGISSSREGLSLFKLLSLHCISALGFLKLRDLLLAPIKNVDELTKRYEFMDFIIDPRNAPVSVAISNGLQKIVNVNKIILRFKHSQGNNGLWKDLFNTILVMLQLKEEIQPFLSNCTLFRDYDNSITDNLYRLETCIDSTLDLKVGLRHNRPYVKTNIDEALDEERNKYSSIKNRLVAAAHIIINHMPPEVDECSVAYVPEMGHTLSVRRWSETCQPNMLQEYGCYFLFEINNIFHYKNALCQELDVQLGDLPAVIQIQENRIIQRVAMYVVNQNQHLIDPLDILAYMDALMSMAKVGSERNYIRPQFNIDNILNIKDGRHPLAEISANGGYVPNDYASDGSTRPHQSMKIITGPNASGKSMYLKQTALLVYMAHVGSYLPATSACISPVHSIHSRLHTTESAALNMSAFVIDVLQMGNALYNAKSSSLIIMDEFGRGTTSDVSQALLLSALRKFLFADDICPHVLIATHLSLKKEFIDSPLVHYQAMSYIRHSDTDVITFLYKIIDGESSSFTFEMAMASCLPNSLIQRAKELCALLDGEINDVASKKEENRFYSKVKIPPFDE